MKKGNKGFQRRRFICAASVGVSALSAVPVAAQQAGPPAKESAPTPTSEGSGDIIVTATRRAESIQLVPVSITALTQQELLNRGADTIEDYARAVPGLIYSKGGANSGTFQIRGISTSTNTSNTQAPVALYYDDLPVLATYAPRVTSDLRLFDVERVEVLRGPQGTLFGSGSLSGAIRVITNKPDSTGVHAAAESTVSTTKEGGESYALNGMINVPLINDALALRVVGYYRRDAGWIDHPNFGGTNDNGEESYGGRAMLRYAPDDHLTVTGYISYQKDDSGDRDYSYYSGGSTYQFANFVPESARQKQLTASLTADYDFGFATLTSVTGYQNERPVIRTDYTAINRRAYGIVPPTADVSTSNTDIFTQELRLTSNASGRLQYVVGAFYSNNKNSGNEQIFTPGAGVTLAPKGYPSDFLYNADTAIRTSELAVFGELTYEVLPHLKATAGVRVFHNTFNLATSASGIYNGGNSAASRHSVEESATPKFVLSYQATPDIMVYAQAARGYRVGAAAVSPPTDPITGQVIPQTYGPDNLWNYEIGIKSTFLDRKLLVNLAAYRINWNDIQLQVRTPGAVYLTNAGNAHSQGIEAEIRIRPVRVLEFGSALAFNESRIDTINTGATATVGDRLPGAPRFSASNTARLNVPLGTALAGYVYFDHVYSGFAYATLRNLGNPAALTIGDYNLFNVRVGLTSGGLEGLIFLNNITNSDGKVAANALPVATGASRIRPRTIGATLRYRF